MSDKKEIIKKERIRGGYEKKSETGKMEKYGQKEK